MSANRGTQRSEEVVGTADERSSLQWAHRVRTWAPRGCTPVLQYHFNWKVLSAAAGITWWNFVFRLYPTTIHAEEVVDFPRCVVLFVRLNVISTNSTKKPAVLFLRPLRRSPNCEKETPHHLSPSPRWARSQTLAEQPARPAPYEVA